jgi:imidazolonepropionase-like amidohydrolase
MSSRHPTINAADLIDHSELFGSITPGKSADIIAVQGDPLADIRTLENVAIGPIAGAAHRVHRDQRIQRLPDQAQLGP